MFSRMPLFCPPLFFLYLSTAAKRQPLHQIFSSSILTICLSSLGSITSPHSSFIALVNETQLQTLENLSKNLDRFRDELSDEDITWLESKRETVSNNANSYVHYRHEEEHNFSDSLVPVYHVVWKTFRKVGILKYVDVVGCA